MSTLNFFLLGAVVVYATIYHNLRQFYGMSKWYQKLNRSFDKVSDLFLYALCSLAFLTIHFRGDLDFTEYYEGANILFTPNFLIKNILTFVFFLTLWAWCLYEFFKAKRTGDIEWARIFSVALPVAVYGVSFMYFKTLASVVFPLVVSHGLSYMALVWFAERKLREDKALSWTLPAAIFSVALLFGGSELFLDELKGEFTGSVWGPVLTAALLTPLFCHYYFDAFLWKSDHPDFQKIVA